MEKQQTLKALSHAPYPFSETLIACTALQGSSHEDGGRGKTSGSLRKSLLSALLHDRVSKEDLKGYTIPEGYDIGKILCLVLLEVVLTAIIGHVG